MSHVLGIVGPFPPQRHGVSSVNEAVARLASSTGLDVAQFNTSPSSLRRSPGVRLGRLTRVAKAGIGAWRFARRHRGATLYFSLSGGWGLLYEAVIISGARIMGASVIVHHHSFRYLDDAFWPLSALAVAAGPRAVHVVLGAHMGERLKQRCPGIGEVLVLSNAAFVPRASEHVSQGRPLRRVGYLANLSREKGLEQVIDTAALCASRGLPLRFVVAGPFENPDAEDSFRGRSANAPNIDYIGPVFGAQKASFFEGIDAFIFPTLYRHEAEPLVVLEALSYGRPVIAYGRGCIPSLLGAGGGHSVPLKSPFPDAAAEWLGKWTSDEQAFREESRQAFDRFSQLKEEAALALERLSSRLGSFKTPDLHPLHDFPSDGKNPIRTLHIAQSLDKHVGGSLHAALEICRYLVRGGAAGEIAAGYKAGDDLGYLAEAYPEVKTHAFARSFPVRYSNSRDFKKWIRQALPSYDIVEIHSVFYGIAWRAARECRRSGKPYYVRPHGSLDPFDLGKHAALKKIVGPLLIRPMLAGARAAVLTSELEAERMVTYGASVKKIVVPLPVPLSETGTDAARFRAQNDIPTDAVVVLFMSRIDQKKGLQLLIPALAALQREFEKLFFVLAGTGDTQSMESAAALLDSRPKGLRVRQVGFLSGQGKADALAAADIFALPSLNENFGIVLVEAMHAGLPLLISDEVYIHNEIVRAGAALVCRPTIASVTETLRRMLDGSIDLPAMGSRGRDLVRDRYRPEAATELLVAAYRDTLQKVRDA